MKTNRLVWVAALGLGLSAGAATYEVTDAGDSGAGTLRWAIQAANTNPGADTITFNLPAPHQIQPATALPGIVTVDGLVIDGTSQPGYAGWPLVTLNGQSAAGALQGLELSDSRHVVIQALVVEQWNNGLSIRGSISNRVEHCLIWSNTVNGVFTERATNCVIGGTGGEGNWIAYNEDVGVQVSGTGNRLEGNFIGTDGTAARPNGVGVLMWSGEDNVVGGTAAGAGNVISGNGNYGIQFARWASNNVVQGNLIGTDETGTAAVSNLIGVYVGGPLNTIGGDGPDEGNWISGNSWGIRLTGEHAWGNVVEGNTIGLGVDDAPVPNEYGVHVQSASNRVGGATIGGGNVVAGNVQYGLSVSGADAAGNEFFNNEIGGDVGNGDHGISINAPGTLVGGVGARQGNRILRNGGHGVILSGADATGGRVEGNAVSLNGQAGVAVTQNEAVSNRISQNSISSNGGLGIELGTDGVTPNDPGDGDTGPNGLQNFPVLTLASNAGVTLAIGGYLESTTGEDFVIEFFDSPECDPTGHGEGASYLGSQTVTTDGAGQVGFTNAAIAAPAIPPSFVTATARRIASQETSEFSRYLIVDSDGDGMPDGWEFRHFGSITGAAPDGHGDADPYTNLEEFIADTDPTDGDDYPRFADIQPESGGVRVSMQTAPSRMYRLEDRIAPNLGRWGRRVTDVAGTGGVVSWWWEHAPDSTSVFRCWAYLP